MFRRFVASHAGRRLLHGAPLIIGLALLSTVLQSLGLLDLFSDAGIDFSNALVRPQTAQMVDVVGITDNDFARVFGSVQPLAAARLGQLVATVAAAHPRAIVVDVVTTDPRFGALRPPPDSPPIVWSQELQWTQRANHVGYVAVPALGGSHAPLATGGDRIIVDGDAFVRRYARYLPGIDGPISTLAWSALRACASAGDAHCASVVEPPCPAFRLICLPGIEVLAEHESVYGDHLLRFVQARFARSERPGSPAWPITDFRTAVELREEACPHAKGPLCTLAEISADWKNGNALRSRIVILAGYYDAARDAHVTAVGLRQGGEIWAQTIENELAGGVKPIAEPVVFALDVAVGVVLLFVAGGSSLVVTLLATLAAAPLLVLGATLLAFQSFAYWFNFVPVVIGIVLKEFIEHAATYARLRRLHPEELD